MAVKDEPIQWKVFPPTKEGFAQMMTEIYGTHWESWLGRRPPKNPQDNPLPPEIRGRRCDLAAQMGPEH